MRLFNVQSSMTLPSPKGDINLQGLFHFHKTSNRRWRRRADKTLQPVEFEFRVDGRT
jgi:hypothetical protein